MKASFVNLRRTLLVPIAGVVVCLVVLVWLHVNGNPFAQQGPRFEGIGQAQVVQVHAQGDWLNQVPMVLVGVSERQFEQIEETTGVVNDGGVHFAIPATYDQVMPLLSDQQKTLINNQTIRTARGSYLITTASRYLCVGNCQISNT